MNLNFVEAFTYFFKDERWKFKISILCFITIIANMLCFLIDDHTNPSKFYNGVIFIMILFFNGYHALLMNNLTNEKDTILPDFNLKNIFKQGFKLTGAIIVYLLLTLIILIIFALIIFIAFTLLGLLLKTVSLNTGTLIVIFQSLSLLCLLLFITIYIMMLIPILFSILTYSENLSFKNVFNIKRILKIFKTNWKNYFIIALLLVLTLLPTSLKILEIIYNNKFIIFTFASTLSITSTLIYLAFINLSTQAYKYSLAKINDNSERIEQLESRHKTTKQDVGIAVLIALISITLFIPYFIFPKADIMNHYKLNPKIEKAQKIK